MAYFNKVEWQQKEYRKSWGKWSNVQRDLSIKVKRACKTRLLKYGFVHHQKVPETT